MSSSNRSQKKAALARFRDIRRKRDMGELDVEEDVFNSIREEEDVFDIVDEDEYHKIVEARRQRDDFVVDDGT
jgi:hypothetical protein